MALLAAALDTVEVILASLLLNSLEMLEAAEDASEDKLERSLALVIEAPEELSVPDPEVLSVSVTVADPTAVLMTESMLLAIDPANPPPVV
jgi:hypothetical protein